MASIAMATDVIETRVSVHPSMIEITRAALAKLENEQGITLDIANEAEILCQK